jgi:predicted nucleotidyltransferase
MTVLPSELTRTLVERERARQEELEARAGALRRALEGAVRALGQRGEIGRAWLIGSLARGGHGPRSDVDLVVEGLPADRWAPVWDELCAALGVEVDLLRIEELGEPFRRRVLAEGVALDVS